MTKDVRRESDAGRQANRQAWSYDILSIILWLLVGYVPGKVLPVHHVASGCVLNVGVQAHTVLRHALLFTWHTHYNVPFYNIPFHLANSGTKRNNKKLNYTKNFQLICIFSRREPKKEVSKQTNTARPALFHVSCVRMVAR